jgi:hypothetical protein
VRDPDTLIIHMLPLELNPRSVIICPASKHFPCTAHFVLVEISISKNLIDRTSSNGGLDLLK